MPQGTPPASQSAPCKPTRAMLEQAARWQAALSCSDVSQQEQQACLQWRAQHPGHEAAFVRMREVWGAFDEVAQPGCQPARLVLERELGNQARRARLRPVVAGASALALALGIAVVSGGHVSALSPDYLLADYRSPVGSIRQVDLPDGSHIILNGGSAADVVFDAAQRRIVLRQGELLAQVAPDAGARPFVVETPKGTARALGTRYLVRTGATQDDVIVLESSVRVCARAVSSCLQAEPGQRVDIHADGVSGPLSVDALAAQAWTHQRLIADDMPLVQVLAALGAHRVGMLRYDAAELAGLRVSGVLPLDDTDRALEVLASHLPVKIKRGIPFVTRVVRQPG